MPWRFHGRPEAQQDGDAEDRIRLERAVRNSLIPLVHTRGERIQPVDDEQRIKTDDEVVWLIHQDRAVEAAEWLAQRGWQPVAYRSTG
jgi:hypothetical protein